MHACTECFFPRVSYLSFLPVLPAGMSNPQENDNDVPASMEVPLSTSLFSRSADSNTVKHAKAVAETLSPVPSALGNGTAARQHGAVVDEAHMRSALPTPLQPGMDTLRALRATEARLRQAQEAELSVLFRLRLLTEALVGVARLPNALAAAGAAATAAQGSGDAEDVSAPPSEGTFRAALPAVIACPLTTGIEEATRAPAEARVTMQCVSMPPAGLSAAARGQYAALRRALARHFCEPEDGGVGGTCDAAASSGRTPSTATPENPQSIEQYEATPSVLRSRTTEVVDTNSTDAPGTHGVAENGAGASNYPDTRHRRAVETQRRTRFFSELRYCPPSLPQRSVSPREQHASTASCDPETSMAAMNMDSRSASQGRRVPHSPPSSHVCGLADRFADTKRGEGAVALTLALPKFSPAYVEDSCAESAVNEERDELREEVEGGHHREEADEAALASYTPAVSPSFATVLTCGSSPTVVKVGPCSTLFPCIPSLSAHRTSAVTAWESSNRAAPDEQRSQDTPTPPTLKSSPHRLSQPRSATPTSTFGDADEEGMYFPRPPPAKTHRRAEVDAELSSCFPAMGNGGSASTGADVTSVFFTMSSPTTSAPSLRRCLAFGSDHDESDAESARAPHSEKRGRVAASSSMHMGDRSCKEAPQTVSAARDMPLPRTPTRVVTATDILATITALPRPSSSSSSSSLRLKRPTARRAHRGGKDTGATGKVNASPAEGQPTHRGVCKRRRGRGDEWGRIDVNDEVLAAMPLAGLPSLGKDVSLSAVAGLGRPMCEETANDRHRRSATARRTESDGHQRTMFEGEHVPCGYVRTREQRIQDIVRTEQVFSAVRAACSPLPTTSSQTPPRCLGADTECDGVLLSPSPPLSQNTPRQFWDINFP
ncbi:conserved hypothetical protein [Leishmania major strain Friedlin]|uniref:Uncharacterized protein n=1 Tax=Leishmania major TaxID=5664 RepID=Q4Q8V6_LEIMA|nr:conserved hypothetical protein [Leishmania major strain Friedlin]CAG9576562.1 hypothetical_protein_-_conserved [Leishmania major strain Friedlin]CAJ05586.1 conserved hypothetical protein [Leishmania major strain Friedlin]|eukprot:XP_001684242.1 conserved hypothetical protein [Leishmania major strain Friedlin]